MNNLNKSSILWLFVILFLFSCKRDENKSLNGVITKKVEYIPYSNSPFVTYIYDATKELDLLYNSHIRKTMEYAKIPYKGIPIETFNRTTNFKDSTHVIVLTQFSKLTKKSFERILKFLNEGGTVVSPSIDNNIRLAFLAGLIANENHEIDNTAYGFKSDLNLLPGLQQKDLKTNMNQYGFKKSAFSTEIEILAAAANDPDYPAIIKRQIGAGQFILFNTTQQFDKRDRGLIFSMILEGLPGIPYSIANANTIFLDDFPAPLYDLKMEPVASEMDVTQAKFYTDYWWPDMLDLAKREELKYSSYVCFDYRNMTMPPYNFEEWELSKKLENGRNISAPDWLMHQILKSSHELALHGYNHASLTLEDWNDEDFMALSLESARKRWKAKNYGKLPNTYVPPSNVIDSLGFVALEQAFPSVTINCSLYLGDFEEGADREFDTEPYNDHFFNYPRITSGYLLNSARQYNMENLFIYSGIWTHFIHADDIYQIPDNDAVENENYEYRNKMNLGWKKSSNGEQGLFPRFENSLREIKDRYPLMRFVTAKEGAELTKDWRDSRFSYFLSDQKVKIQSIKEENATKDAFWFVYILQKDILRIEAFLKDKNWSYSKTNLHGGKLFMIQTSSPEIEIPIVKTSLGKVDILSEFDKYKQKEDYGLNGDTSFKIERLIENINLGKGDIQTWRDLYTYLGWQGRSAEIWPLLKENYLKSNDAKLLNLSEDFIKNSDYPDMETRRFWMLEKIKIFNGTAMKLSFIKFFGNSKKINFSITELKELLNKSSIATEQQVIVSKLLADFPEESIVFFSSLDSCSDKWKGISSTVAWFMADNGNYVTALQWAECTAEISEENKNQWLILTGDLTRLKDENYKLYISQILYQKPEMAFLELSKIPACQQTLREYATDIAYLFAKKGDFDKAINWSNCSDNFSIQDRIVWLGNLNRTHEINLILEENEILPDHTLEFLTYYFWTRSEYTKAWQIAMDMKDSDVKTSIRIQLNKDVKYIPTAVQKELIDIDNGFLKNSVREFLKRDIRRKEGNYIIGGTQILADRLNPTYYQTSIGYGFNNGRGLKNEVSFTQGAAYSLQIPFIDSNNVTNHLYGLRYSLKKNLEGKKRMQFALGIETNDSGDIFYHAAGNVNWNSKVWFHSLSAKRRPAMTGPAYALKIYQDQVAIYEESTLSKNSLVRLSFEGNHYSDDNTLDGTLMAGFVYKVINNENSILAPYSEVYGTLGTNDKRSGFPYWTIDERFFGGAGINYSYHENQPFSFQADAAFFLDTFSEQFQRYRFNLKYDKFRNLDMIWNAEFYTLKNFYSNNLSFKILYYF